MKTITVWRRFSALRTLRTSRRPARWEFVSTSEPWAKSEAIGLDGPVSELALRGAATEAGLIPLQPAREPLGRPTRLPQAGLRVPRVIGDREADRLTRLRQRSNARIAASVGPQHGFDGTMEHCGAPPKRGQQDSGGHHKSPRVHRCCGKPAMASRGRAPRPPHLTVSVRS